MRLLTLLRRARMTAILAVGAAVVTTVPVAAPPAAADPTGTAAAHAASVLAEVHRLHAEALAAEKHYGQALAGVADSVNQAITADQASDVTSAQAQAAQAALDDRVRNLYESGGTVALYASFLVTASVTDFAARAELASRIVSTQAAAARTATSRADAVHRMASRAGRSEQHQIVTERSVAAVATRVQALLDHERTLLRQADQHLAAVRQAQAALAAQTSAFGSITTAQIAGLHVLPPPAAYLSLYKSAATTCSGLSWTVLAAIGQVESGHGRNSSASPAGAMGPMQFMPGTFRTYAVDGDHSGSADIMSPADSIYTAAHYLCANGAGRGPGALSAAILHYNHATWYVAMVLKLAGLYASSTS